MNIDQGNDLAADPTLLFDLSVAYWRSSVLFTALDLDLFNVLGDAQKSTAELCQELNVPERSLLMLLNALKVLDLLIIDQDKVCNTSLTRTYLCNDQPSYLGNTIMFNARSYPAWGKLTKAVKENKPAMDSTHFLGKDKEATRNFVLAMHNRAKSSASCLVNMLDLANVDHLLDLGGGPGTYSMMLTEKYPNLKTTVIDLPDILQVTEEIIQSSSAKDRIFLRPGDIFDKPFGVDFDAVLISGVLHRTEGESTVEFLRKAADSLTQNGLLAVSDLFTGGKNNGPVLPELFSLHMMLTANEGQSLHIADMEKIFDEAGFKLKKITPYPPPLPHTLFIAEKR